jgi:hypothetical protein
MQMAKVSINYSIFIIHFILNAPSCSESTKRANRVQLKAEPDRFDPALFQRVERMSIRSASSSSFSRGVGGTFTPPRRSTSNPLSRGSDETVDRLDSEIVEEEPLAEDAIDDDDDTGQDVAVLMYGEVPEYIYPEAGAPTELGAAQKYSQQRFAPRVNEAARVSDTSTTLDPSFQQIIAGTVMQEQHLGLACAIHHKGEQYKRTRPVDLVQRDSQASHIAVSAAAAEMDRVQKRPRLEKNPGMRCSVCKGKHRLKHDKRNCPDCRMLPGQQLLPFPKKSSSSSSSSHH